jgi:hypothetical protein
MNVLLTILRAFRLFALLVLALVALAGLGWLEWRFDRGSPYTEERKVGSVTYTPRWRFSQELRTIASFADATDVEILSLEPPYEAAAGYEAARAACTPQTCVENNRILGRVPVADAADRAELAGTLSGWLRDAPDYAAGCEPMFRHAIAWRDGDTRRVVLLCYSCGIYQVTVDGAGGAFSYGQGGHTEGDALLNARLLAAGIRHYDNATDSWVPGRDEAMATTSTAEAR